MSNEINNNSGPIFESGPGWGVKTKDWLNQYRLYVLILIVLVISGILISSSRNKSNNEISENFPGANNENQQNSGTISEIVNKGDSATLVTRRAITNYINAHPDVNLTSGQRVFMEEVIRNAKKLGNVIVGSTINFTTAEIESAINKAQSLTPYQLQVWAKYASRVKF